MYARTMIVIDLSELAQIAFGEVKDEIRRGLEPDHLRGSFTKLVSPRAVMDRLQKKIASPLHSR